MTEHALITWLSCTDDVTAHALMTWLIGHCITLQRRKLRLREIRVPISDREQISENKLCSHKHLEMVDKM